MGNWYVACSTRSIRKPIQVRIHDERLVIFRDEKGKAVALQDRCLHRCTPLSLGTIENGALRCGYHGWLYGGSGQVLEIPSMKGVPHGLRARKYPVVEQQGYVYVALGDRPPTDMPFELPRLKGKIRLLHRFKAGVTQCAQNFIDVPHTAFVHPGIFRMPKGEKLRARILRDEWSVIVDYDGEKTNLGWFKLFLNPSRGAISHRDRFIAPNITWVTYDAGPKRIFHIISQCIDEGDGNTRVHTDLAYDYGIWTKPARPFVQWSAKRIIAQDIAILAAQAESQEHYRAKGISTPSDRIHFHIEALRSGVRERHEEEIEFLV